MYYAYILESESVPGELYRGHTSDSKQRLAEHNAGRCLHTSTSGPWRLKFYAAFETLELAQQFERVPAFVLKATQDFSFQVPFSRLL